MRSTKTEAGFSLIDVLFTMAIIGTLSTIAMPGLLRARTMASTAGAIGTIRVINSGQLSYAITCGSGFYAPALTTLAVPAAGTTQAFVPGDIGAANIIFKNNFRVQMTGAAIASSPQSCNGLGAGLGTVGYRVGADSLDPTFPVHYSSNTSGAVWTGAASLFATTGEPTAPPGGTLVK